MKSNGTSLDFQYDSTIKFVLEKAVTATIDASLSQIASIGYDLTLNTVKYKDNIGIKNFASQEWVTANFDTNTLANGNIFVGNASNVATSVAMSGEASIINTGVVTLSNAAVIGKVLTGYISGSGTISATDSLLSAIQKLNGNISLAPTGSGASGQITIWNGTSTQTGSNNLFWDIANFRLGLGTITPSDPIQIVSNSSMGQAIAFDYYSNDANSGNINFRKARGTTPGTATAVNSGDALALMAAHGYGATSFQTSPTGLLAFTAAENFTDTAQGTNFSIALTPIGSISRSVLAFTLLNSGFAGFGTSNPAAKIDLVGNISTPSWTTSGIIARIRTATYTDTTGSGTIARVVFNNFGQPTMDSTSAITVTNLYNIYVGNAARVNNTSATNTWALGLNGNLAFDVNAAISTVSTTSIAIQTNLANRTLWSATGLQTQTQDVLSSGTTAFITYTQAAHTGGAQPGFLWTAGALTGQTTATEITDINYNLSAAITMVDGTVATQRAFRIQGRTYTPVTSALTLTTAVVLDVGISTAGVGTTITNNYSARFGGGINVLGNIIMARGASAALGTSDSQSLLFGTNNTFNRITITSTGLQTLTHDNGANSTFMTYNQGVNSAGVGKGLLWVAGAHTNQTANTEVMDIQWNLSAVMKMADGTVASNRAFLIQGRTYTPQTSALTLTKAVTLSVTPPIAGVGTTITTNVTIECNGNFLLPIAGNRILIKEGSGGFLGQTTLVSGTKSITISGLTTSHRAFPGFVSQGGTSTAVYQYAMVCTANTLTITAITVAGITVTTDTSVINYVIFEPAP